MSYIEGLLIERQGYITNGKPGRVAEVDAELARFNVAVAKDGTVSGWEPEPEDGAPVIETTEADHSKVEKAVIKRGTGRRKSGDAAPAKRGTGRRGAKADESEAPAADPDPSGD